MTSGASTPAGNYRTENIIHHSQGGHAHTSTFAHTWNMGGVARGASAWKYLSMKPMQSSRRGPRHLQQIQVKRREKTGITIFTYNETKNSPACLASDSWLYEITIICKAWDKYQRTRWNKVIIDMYCGWAIYFWRTAQMTLRQVVEVRALPILWSQTICLRE